MNQVVFLQYGNEGSWLQKTKVGVIPAGKSFRTAELSVGSPDDRLLEDLDVAVLNGIVYAVYDIFLPIKFLVHHGVVFNIVNRVVLLD